MARRRTFLERPHAALSRAAEAHARLAAGEPHPSETGEGPPLEQEPSANSKSARSQKRDQGGKFA